MRVAYYSRDINTIKMSFNKALRSTEVQIGTVETHKIGHPADLATFISERIHAFSLHRECLTALMHYCSNRTITAYFNYRTR